ncbi:23S rRNA (pseudouridine(1915)-N(3))-methyltransferase RlmH [Marinobacter sp. M3C]|jgi:23S rRNA (pseudouridine1915-N3)-methyltransferase|uniref:23S rRNA (pseudouridine(1915)-N(3))-methyltransferase RlmH n=1 Tax=unclassified Marinobacter TaxID=83889 RepID=UPI00200C3142|nr:MULTISPECIES: 23S rRNA (pseudouridine(1915)-N(3))-methyltransferase RlmH [unclassified Marinobacter]MCL1478092.1 23S rRNA (pseudouridine(1915)-N(3))-methyltransferase RlmH [Marinobacter sp.]MCL1482319.1 23S rRNA (pseudouridine(1915)-N(3))-methyltransferase RlmH [Marinobacter sp.]MCL1485363.1 23S rRNA (pseudouridine(1915)-N(3))-methyltransferase RlmH [Marinobacter sp.]MCL1489062.1 23S rRNA (pseudouridine(1915)-N(3))-methyltransferase RlmH [Marinobacter sp.]UQG56935.1 23S rRNA (pseudouridine(
MRLRLICVGQKMPDWVSAGYLDYARRMPPELSLELVEIAMAHRGKNPDIPRLMQRESDAILVATQPKDRVVALEVGGQPWSTEKLAAQLENWQQDGGDVNFLVGGPDGLADACRQRADQQWSLSPLTLPHPLVRIVLAEQLYRAWSITRNHPYHRA